MWKYFPTCLVGVATLCWWNCTSDGSGALPVGTTVPFNLKRKLKRSKKWKWTPCGQHWHHLGPKIAKRKQATTSYKGGGRFPAVFPVSWFMNCFVNSSADPAIPALFASKRFPHLSEPAPETFGLDFSTISTITILIVHHLQAPEVFPSHPSSPSLVSNSP